MRYAVILLLTILLQCFCHGGYGQEAGPVSPVEGIRFEGLRKTKSAFLEQNLIIEAGRPLDSALLYRQLQDFKNLPPVADARMRIDTADGERVLVFDIDEALTLFPIINFGGVEGNFWFQLGLTDINWMGNGHHLTAFYQNTDLRHNFQVFYRVPQFGRSRWGTSANVFRWATVEPLFFDQGTVYYDYDNSGAGLTAIYRSGRRQWLEGGLTYFVEQYRKNERHLGESTPGPDQLRQQKGLVKLLHHFDRIDQHFFYQSGFDNVALFQTVYTFSDQTWFHFFQNDTRYFRRLGRRGNLAARLRLGIATNRNTPFAPFVLDSYINIRGSGNRMERGTAAAIFNLEYRHAVLDHNLFAAQIVGFSDMGAWRKPGGKLEELFTKKGIRHFVGGGIRIIYKKAFNAILRLDYGVELQDPKQRGVVIGVGQYF